MFFGTTAVIGIKAKQRERERETKKNNKSGCRVAKFFFFKDCFRTGVEEDGKGGGRWKRRSAVEVGQVREAGGWGGGRSSDYTDW